MSDYKTDSTAFSGKVNPFGDNMPPQYADSVQKQYLGTWTKAMLKRAFIACDYVAAQIQGLQDDDFFAYTPKKIRFADAKSLSPVSSKKADDYKEMLIDDPNVSYVPYGAKVVTMGSTFLVINPYNLSGALPKTLLLRCNTSYNSYDEYGNIVTEPIIIQKELMTGNENEPLKKLVLMEGYFNVICQKNPNTEKLNQNQRIILGTKPYYITGFNDFTQQFSGDRDSVKLLTFTVRIEEPTEYDDIEKNFIAGGKLYPFGATIDGSSKLRRGLSSPVYAHFTVNGKVSDLPATWTFTSSDDSVASVANLLTWANILTNAAGTATITATMNENPKIQATLDITVTEEGDLDIEFLNAVPRKRRASPPA